MAFKKWWCDKCHCKKGYLSSSNKKCTFCRHECIKRVCNECGQVVKELPSKTI